MKKAYFIILPFNQHLYVDVFNHNNVPNVDILIKIAIGYLSKYRYSPKNIEIERDKYIRHSCPVSKNCLEEGTFKIFGCLNGSSSSIYTFYVSLLGDALYIENFAKFSLIHNDIKVIKLRS